MTRIRIAPTLLLISLVFILPATNISARGRRAKAAPVRADRRDKRGRADRGRDRSAARQKAPAHETRAERRRREREEARADNRRGGRRMSRRERLLEARREAEARRRAELARLAAIARARAIEQALRNEVAANVAKDDPTGEDPEVRRAAVAALGNHIATVVVMDPKSGRVYSIVNQEWAVRRGYKPCSTMKLVTGLAGLSDHVIDPLQEASLVSVSTNRMDLTDALAFSNNGYFQNVSGRVGFDHMVSYARQLGLGERTGINHANEYPGRVPLFKQGYAVNHMGSHGDDFEVTPVQLATLVSVFANGGTLVTPHLPRTPEENVHFKTEVRRQLNIPQDVLRRMLTGMVAVVNYGTGKKAYTPGETIAGKTGTCIEQDGWIGLFTSYAPVEDPQLAIAVIGRGPDARGHATVAIAGQIYRSLAYRFGRRGNQPPFSLTPEVLQPRPQVNPAIAAGGEDTDDNAADADDADSNAAAANAAPTDNTNVAGATPTAGNVRRVLQPLQPGTAAPNVKPAGITPRPTATVQPTAAPSGVKPAANETRPRRVNPSDQQ